MTSEEISNIRAFVKDERLNTAVKGVLLSNFLRARTNADVHILAAQTLAVQFLSDAWAEMERYKQDGKKTKGVVNLGM